MTRAVGKLIDSDSHPFYHGDTVTIELPRGMRVIGKREKCQYFCKQSTYYTSCSLDADGRYHLVDKTYCPCHNWKARKK